MFPWVSKRLRLYRPIPVICIATGKNPAFSESGLSLRTQHCTLSYLQESAFTGVETCPNWAPTGTNEIHISSDVAISVWQYWQVR